MLLVLRLLWTAFVIATPLLGVWTASSLATYLNGPVALAVASGFLLFPGLPLLWDALANHRRASLLSRRREARERQGLAFEPPRRILTFGDRLILRTLVLNGAFLGGLVAAYPEAGFAALSTRGDWMLEGRRDATSEQLRARLLQGASMLQWAYELAHDNPYREAEVDPPPPSGTRGGQLPELPADPEPAPQPDAPDAGVPEAVAEGGDALPEAPAEEARAEPAVERKRGWPLPATLHPAVVALPKEQEGSIESVAAHLAAEERDPYFLVKALHDYVADRIVYDVPAYRSGDIPPQDAETTFRTRKSVCAGYAKLLRALGKAAGVEIRYVPGDARHSGWEVTGEPHAWNAVEIDGEWYLIDATWNAGGVGDDGFTKAYTTTYLFTPPEAFGISHLPDDARWQLRERPLTRGEFMRQPALSPDFFSYALDLLDPTQSQVTVEGLLQVQIGNPEGRHMLASFETLAAPGRRSDCAVVPGPNLVIDCRLPAAGRYHVILFANTVRYGSYDYVGQLAVNNAP